jgi:hypothetical protein
MEIKRPFGHARQPGNILGGGAGVPLVSKDIPGRSDELSPSFFSGEFGTLFQISFLITKYLPVGI